MEAIQILVVDDNLLCLQGLIANLTTLQESPAQQPALRLCGRATNGKEALELAAVVRPDVVIMDIQMPVMNGIVATRELCRLHPEVKVLGLTMFSHENLVVDMMEAGATGYMDKLHFEKYLADAIRTVQKGLTYICPTTSMRQARLLIASRAELRMAPVVLNEEELQLMRFLCQEYTAKEIACKFGVSETTVNRKRRQLEEKLGAKSVVGVVLYARRMGIV